jgi:hypothetical protein
MFKVTLLLFDPCEGVGQLISYLSCNQYFFSLLHFAMDQHLRTSTVFLDRFCGLVVRVPGYRFRDPGSIPALTDFLRSSGSGTGSTQRREYN